ncbi:MAG: hypothetical protein LC650_00910 [Actinobacteria bacterium]|nr:hypothetical protein [Actinomycetota bacterium]
MTIRTDWRGTWEFVSGGWTLTASSEAFSDYLAQQAAAGSEYDANRPPTREEAVAFAVRLTMQDRLDTLPDADIETVAPLFDPWKQPEGAHDAYPLDAVVRYDGVLWKSTLADNVWTPGESGWHRYGATEDAGPQPWVQPTGAHDTYSAGAVVTHNGSTWNNTHGDGNSWEPGVYGWSEA